jgi:hypothetical protein
MATPNASSEQEQALAVFNHAAEEIRFFKRQQWLVTNYALLAYGALAAVPPLIGDCEDVANWICDVASLGCAFVGVPLVAIGAGVALWSLGKSQEKERRRMDRARGRLPVVAADHANGPVDGRLISRVTWVLWAALAGC